MPKDTAQRLTELSQLPHLKALAEVASKLQIPAANAPPKSLEDIRATAQNLKVGDGVVVVLRAEKIKLATAVNSFSIVRGVVAKAVNPTSDKPWHHVAWLLVMEGPDWIPKGAMLALPQDGSLSPGDTPMEYGPLVVIEAPKSVDAALVESSGTEAERKSIVFSTLPDDDEGDVVDTDEASTDSKAHTFLQGNIATFMNGLNPEGGTMKDGREAPGWKLLVHCPPAVAEARRLQLEVFITQTFSGLGVDPQDKAMVTASIEALKLNIQLYIQAPGLLEVAEWKAALHKHIVVLRSWYYQRHHANVRKEVARQLVTNFQTDPWPEWVIANEFEYFARNHAVQTRTPLTLYTDEDKKRKEAERKEAERKQRQEDSHKKIPPTPPPPPKTPKAPVDGAGAKLKHDKPVGDGKKDQKKDF